MCAQSQELREKSAIKNLNNCGDVADTATENLLDRLFVAPGSRLIKEYADLGLQIHVHFIFWLERISGEINVGNFCAVFQRIPVWDGWRYVDGLHVVDGVGLPSGAKLPLSDDQHPMFIDNIEFRDNPKQVGFSIPPGGLCSYVGLKIAGKGKCEGGNERFNSVRDVFKPLLSDGNRESGLFGTTNVMSVPEGKLQDHVVKCRPKIVNDIASNHTPVEIVTDDILQFDIKMLPIRLIFEGGRMLIRFRRAPSRNGSVKIREVMFSSFKFGLDAE
jgi:hypothetical protein